LSNERRKADGGNLLPSSRGKDMRLTKNIPASPAHGEAIVACELVYYDIIKAERMPNVRGGGWHISRDNIERFFQEYVFATEIAEKLGIVSIMVRRLLEERGIFPVSGPGVDGAKKLLYRRTAEIEQFIRDYSDRQGGEFSLISSS
jgi:hypothetical protein